MTPEQERLFAESIDSMERMATPGNVRLEAAKAVLARARTADAAERERDEGEETMFKALARAAEAERELAEARELELQRGNALGRIAVALLGNQNNVSDDAVVAAAERVAGELAGAREDAERYRWVREYAVSGRNREEGMTNQDKLMLHDPATGEMRPYPSHAEQWRIWHGYSTAWLFNPWTGARRDARDVGMDVQGRAIAPTP